MDGSERRSSIEGKREFDKILKFKTSLKRATTLFKSASELLSYCFPKSSSFEEVLEQAWECCAQNERSKEQLRNLVTDLSQMLCEAARDSMAAFAKANNLDIELEAPNKWPIYACCEGSKLVNVTIDSIVLFYALYETRSISGLYSNEELDEMEEILRAASKLVNSVESESFGEKLPPNVLMALDEELYTKKMAKKTDCTLQTEGILREGLPVMDENKGTEQTSPTSTTSESEQEFVSGCENLIERIKLKQFDIDEMERLSNLPVSGLIKDGGRLLETFCHWLPTVQNIYDIRVMQVYLTLLKKIMMKCEQINSCVQCIYRVSNDLVKDIPAFYEKYSNYNNEFIGLINGLGDHTQFQNNAEKLDKVVREFAFLFAIDAKKTIWLTLQECINQRLIVPNVMKILRRLPAVVELKLELNKVERSTSTQQIPLITLALRELVLSRSVWLENAETSSCFIYLIQSLVKERYAQVKPNREEQSKQNESADNKEEQQSQEHEEGTTDKSTQDKSSKKYGEVLDCAVLNSSELLMDLILPWMFASNGAEIALDLLARILADYETKRTPIEWNIEIREDDLQRANLYERFPVALCIKLLVDIVCHYGNDDDGNGGDKNATKRDRNESNALVVQSLALKCLANLGEKLKHEGVRFGEKTRDFLLDVLNGRDWTVKYVVLSWFDECFEKPKRQIPEVLFKSISEERQHNFESICVNFDSAPVECFFRSIFELGVLSPQLANQFLDDGVSVKPADIELNVKIAMAFIDSMRVGTPNDRLLVTCDVLDKLLNVLDPSLELNPVTFYNQSTVYGLRLVASLKILGDAVILTQRDVKKEPSRRNRDISEKLLSVWCQRAKSHIERELIDLRRSRLRYVPNIRDPLPIPDDVKIDRLCRVKTELAELFSIAVMISKCVDEITPQLQILLKTLAQFDEEVNRMGTGPILDILQLDSKDDGTVYAFAKTSAHPSDLSAQTQVADPSAQTRTADPSDPSAQTQIPQAHAQFRTGAFGGDNETAETIQAFRRNSDTDYENRQGFGQNNYYKDNRAQYDDHQHTSASNTLFEMNSEMDRNWRSQDVRLQNRFENEGRAPYHNRSSPSTSSNRYDGEWGNRSPRRGSDQNRDRYGSGRSKASRRRDHPDRPALPEEDHYDDSRANRNSRDYRSKDYEAHQNQMVARGQFSGRDMKASGSRGEMGISNRARRADQRFDSSEVKTRNADDQWRKTTEKSQAHSPTRIRADGWRSHENASTKYDSEERQDSTMASPKRQEDTFPMQDSQTNNEQERNEQYQKQIREWGQVDEKIEQRGTEASNTQACDRNASVQSNDGSPQDDGRELPPRESASLFKENEDMANSYANDGFSKRQNAKQWGGRANLAQENRGRKMFPERNGSNATTDISSDSANWNQQAGTSNRHRSNDDRNKFQKGQQKYFDRGDEDAVKPASKARSRERGGYRSEHPASMHGQRLVREVTKSTVQGDRMNFTDNDRDSGNRYYSEARSARRKNEEWSHDKGGNDENGNLSAQDKRQLAAWNVGSENENDNCMQQQDDEQIKDWNPPIQTELSTTRNQQMSSVTAVVHDEQDEEMSSKTTENCIGQESNRRANEEYYQQQSCEASENEVVESADRLDESRDEEGERQGIMNECSVEEDNVNERSETEENSGDEGNNSEGDSGNEGNNSEGGSGDGSCETEDDVEEGSHAEEVNIDGVTKIEDNINEASNIKESNVDKGSNNDSSLEIDNDKDKREEQNAIGISESISSTHDKDSDKNVDRKSDDNTTSDDKHRNGLNDDSSANNDISNNDAVATVSNDNFERSLVSAKSTELNRSYADEKGGNKARRTMPSDGRNNYSNRYGMSNNRNHNANAPFRSPFTENPVIQNHEANLINQARGSKWIYDSRQPPPPLFIAPSTTEIHGYVAKNATVFRPSHHQVGAVMATRDPQYFNSLPPHLPAAILPPNAPSVRGQGYHPMPAYTSPPPFNGDAPILSVINEDGNAPRNRRGTTRENQRERHSDQPRRGRNTDNYSTNETMNTHNSYGRKKQGGGPRFNQKYAEGDS